jgi:hypothetical protein
MLLAQAGASHGFLLLDSEAGLHLAAPEHGDEPPDRLVREAEKRIRAFGEDGASTVSVADRRDSIRPGDRRRWKLFVLRRTDARDLPAIGVAALPTPVKIPKPELVHEVARALQETGDVAA